MSPRFATTTLPARMRGLGLPMAVALSLILIVVGGMFAIMVVTVRSLDATSRAQRSTSQMTQDGLALERLVVDLETGLRGYMLTDDRRFLEPYERARGQLRGRLDALEAAAPPLVRPRIARISRAVHSYVDDYTEPLIRDRAADPVAATGEGKARLDRLRGEFAALSSAQAALTGVRRDKSEQLRDRMLLLAAGGAVISAL